MRKWVLAVAFALLPSVALAQVGVSKPGGSGSMTYPGTGLPISTGSSWGSSLAPTDDSVVVGNGSAWQLKALTTCTGTGKAVTYDASTNTFGCNTISGASVPGSDKQGIFNDGGAFGASSGFTFDKTTGVIQVTGGLYMQHTAAPSLRFYEPSGGGSDYLAFQAPALAASVTWILPTTDSTGTQCLASNGSGTLSWAACSGGGGSAAGSDTYYQFNDGGTSFGGAVGATYNKTTQLSTFTGVSLSGSSATGIMSLAQTWNTSGSPTAFLLNVTNTASGSSAKLMDLQVGGSSQWYVTKAGVTTQNSTLTVGTAGTTATARVIFVNANQYIRVGDGGPAGLNYVTGYAAAGAGHEFYGYVDAGGRLRMKLDQLTWEILFGDSAVVDQLAILPVAKGTTSYKGTWTSADLTAARTWKFPDADIDFSSAASATYTTITGITVAKGVVTSISGSDAIELRADMLLARIQTLEAEVAALKARQ